MVLQARFFGVVERAPGFLTATLRHNPKAPPPCPSPRPPTAPGRAVPLDRNAKARIAAYARAHRGQLTRAALDVLTALLWGFHNARSGVCYPSYESIADRAGCARSTVAAALKALEWVGVLTWQNRITRVRERCADLFGRDGWRWRVIRTSNAYQFTDPKPGRPALPASKSDCRTGTGNQEFPPLPSALRDALHVLKECIEKWDWPGPGPSDAAAGATAGP